MSYPAGLLHNTSTDRWHPILFRHAPPPSGDVTSASRYKSIGHHTEGFKSKQEALDHIKANDTLEWMNTVWDWDGSETPAMVIWGPKCPSTTS
jgi:hypothetical protein